MINYLKFLMIIISYHIPLFSHCQIPCGIYSDAMQIMQIKEDLSTIEKAMKEINYLSTKSDPQSLNQINRWVNTKEIHSQNIQKITSEYFLTQRIKQNSENYTKKVIILHQLLVSVMKCKQTTDNENISKSKEIVENFSQLYFDKHGLDHLNKLKLGSH